MVEYLAFTFVILVSTDYYTTNKNGKSFFLFASLACFNSQKKETMGNETECHRGEKYETSVMHGIDGQYNNSQCSLVSNCFD